MTVLFHLTKAGYVLRRLLRRAVRYSKKLNINRPFMFELVPVVGEVMKDFYPEVLEKKDFIAKVKNEEERFHETLHDGEAILAEVIAKAKKNNCYFWSRCVPSI